jgi:protoheme IX farnesyltransferase
MTLIPYFTGMCEYESVSGLIGLFLILLSNGFMIMRCIKLYTGMDVPAARRVMFGSYLYLPLVLLGLLMSKA